MKKFIVSFRFGDFNLSAKVHVRKSATTIISSFVLFDVPPDFDLESISMFFAEHGNSIHLILISESGDLHVVEWRINATYVSTDVVNAEETFSLS